MSSSTRILVKEAEFRQAHSSLTDSLSEFNELLSDVQTTNLALSNCWHGASGNAFYTVSSKLLSDLTMLNTGLTRLTAELKASCEALVFVDDRTTVAREIISTQKPWSIPYTVRDR
ncbi:MAG: WXG100 family type VII secretion target [Coriobacteriia bacterium]|nr:WXG100 family type VII secretion target [Coriobacteriia bacterium]